MSSQKLAKLAELASRARGLDQFAEELDDVAVSSSRTTLRRRAALLRSFDRDAVRVIAEGLDADRAIAELINDPAVESIDKDRWRLRGEVRERYRAEWELSEHDADFREWNRKLGHHLLSRPATSENQLDVLYHLAVGDRDRAVAVFRDWFERADARFDMAQCNGLLEILRIRARWRGRRLSREYEECNQYYVSRMLFFEDYYRTGRYYERESILSAFKAFLDNEASWVFHLHATGGVGKTIFLRWLVARYLVPRPRRVACARVDFDEFKLIDVVSYPLQLLIQIVEQIDRQLPSPTLTELLEKLHREKTVPGWNDGLWPTVHFQLKGAQIGSPVVVILDTLEEATLSHGAWLADSIRRIGELRDDIPHLKLVLSGRYDIIERVAGISTDGWTTYELRRFAKVEADQFLTSLSVNDGDIRAAIIERTIAEETDGRCNPFKLSLFAELAVNRKTLTREDVLRLPRADFAYLIERIIARIESQPLRWAIRYGAVFRELTLELVDRVLLAPLQAALAGTGTEYGIAKLPDVEREYVEGLPPDEKAKYVGAWQPDPAALEELSAIGVWDLLRRYARDRGWLSVDEARRAARFHPEVIAPIRDLLRRVDIYPSLQRSALDYFQRLAAEANSNEEWVAATAEAVFHRFQLEGMRAEAYWQEKVVEAERRGFRERAAIAGELLKKEYAEAERIPLVTGEPPVPITRPEALALAHAQVAESLMLAAGASFSEEAADWGEFRRHVEVVGLIERDAGRSLLPRLLDGLYQTLGNEDTQTALRERLTAAGTHRERFFLEWHLARVLARAGDAGAAAHYRHAIELYPAASPVGFGLHEIWLRLADWYDFVGDYTATGAALHGAAEAARHGRDPEATTIVELRRAELGLAGNDLETTEAWVRKLPRPKRSRRLTSEELAGRTSASFHLEARYALARLDPGAALERAERALDTAANAADKARGHEVIGDAHAMLLGFSSAFDAYDLADSLYDEAGLVTGSARCMLQRIKVKARLMGHYHDAQLLLASATGLRGAKDVEIRSEVDLLQAIVLALSGRLDEAREVLTGLEQASTNRTAAALLARARLVSLGFGVVPADQAGVNALGEMVQRVRPERARLPLLEVLDFPIRPLEGDRPAAAGLLQLFVPAGTGAPGFVADSLRMARLCQVFGDRGRAVDYAMRAVPGVSPGTRALIPTWRATTLLAEMGETKRAAELRETLDLALAGSTMAGAATLLAASDALATGDLDRAAELLTIARNTIFSEPLVSRWHAEVARIESCLAEERGERERADDLRREAAASYEHLGDLAARSRLFRDGLEPMHEPEQAAGQRPETGGGSDPTITLRVTDQSIPFLKPDVFLSRVFADWPGLAADMSRSLGVDPTSPPGGPIRLELQPWCSLIPWEMAAGLEQADAIHRPAGARTFRRPLRPGRVVGEGLAVQIIQSQNAGGFRGTQTYESASGSDLERVYYFAVAGGVPVVVSRYVEPRGLYQELADGRPAAIHVVAAVREFSGGVYLDFASTEERIAHRERPSEAFLDPGLFDRILSGLPEPPFVILDVSRPANLTAVVETLLLRNQFASQLFEFGNTAGILAIGLTSPDERESAIAPLIQGLLRGASAAALIAQERRRGRSQGIDRPPFELISSLGAALFSDDPARAPFTGKPAS